MSYVLTPCPKLQFIDANGNPYAGGKLYTYYAGTDNLADTYSNNEGTLNTNPIILDTAGRATIFLDSRYSYKFVLYDSNDVLIFSQDNINSGISNTITIIDNIETLRTIEGNDNQFVYVKGYYTANDGGEGLFRYSSSAVIEDDEGMYIQPAGVTNGRWVRVITNNMLTIKQYGAIGDGVFDDTNKFLLADNTANDNNYSLFINNGIYYITQNIEFESNIVFDSNAMIKMSSGTLTFNKCTINDKLRHFYFTGNAVANLLDKDIIYPEWFGVIGDGSQENNTPATDNTITLQSTINSMLAGQILMFDGQKKYWTGSLQIKNGIKIKSSGIIVNTDYHANLCLNETAVFLDAVNKELEISDIVIDGNNNASTLINCENGRLTAKRCIFKNATNGINFAGNTTNNIVIDNIFYNVANMFIYENTQKFYGVFYNNIIKDTIVYNTTFLTLYSGKQIISNTTSYPAIESYINSTTYPVHTVFNTETLGKNISDYKEIKRNTGIDDTLLISKSDMIVRASSETVSSYPAYVDGLILNNTTSSAPYTYIKRNYVDEIISLGSRNIETCRIIGTTSQPALLAQVLGAFNYQSETITGNKTITPTKSIILLTLSTSGALITLASGNLPIGSIICLINTHGTYTFNIQTEAAGLVITVKPKCCCFAIKSTDEKWYPQYSYI